MSLQNTSRRRFLTQSALTAVALTAAGIPWIAAGEASLPWTFNPSANIVPAPKDPALWGEYRERLAQWRSETRSQLHYDDTLYRRPEFAWSASAYSCGFIMMCDEAFYSSQRSTYNVNTLLDDGIKDFGGYDSVVLWHAYPRIGVDQRNQYDFYRDMPGGLEGVRNAVRQFHARNVRVYINYNPWDTGTRREAKPDIEMLAEMVRVLEVDGIFLDTMKEGAAALRQQLDTARRGVVLEGEATPPLARVADHHASWAQWFDDSAVPGVLRLKWLERRHMQHQIKRWDLSHTGELQTAWMNGTGMMVWENVFGTWVQWNARDRSVLRQMLPIQRRYTALFQGEDWVPLVPTAHSGVFASAWKAHGVRLWTLVNRATVAADGGLLQVDDVPGQRFYDLIAGRELKPARSGSTITLEGTIPAAGIGCFLAIDERHADGLSSFLAAQARTYERASEDKTHPVLPITLKPAAATKMYASPPAGMVAIHARGKTFLNIVMRARECGFYDDMGEAEKGLRGSYRFETRNFVRPLLARSYAIDETPVTNAEFAAFLHATSYRPVHTTNFLKHWIDGKMPSAKADHPVVWVDLNDARAYAAWAHKRLPTEEEWQYAAEGDQGNEYPWGSGVHAGVCNMGETGDTTPVRAFPAGRSATGCYDLCGNVWQWTESERTDSRTRFCIIRGGSYFAPEGSNWYVDGGPRPTNFATKFLMMWPGLDRCATIGFRCAVDLQAAVTGA